MALANSMEDPKLERIRTLVKSEDNSAVYQELLNTCGNIHASYLFHRHGLRALKELCTVVSSTPSGIHYNSWRNLASILGFSYHQIQCINNYKEDPTELTLKAFAQKPDASLEKIIKSLKEIQRFDALSCAKPHLIALAKHIEDEVLHEENSIYSSLNESTKLAMKIAGLRRPPESDNIDLPITLKEPKITHEKGLSSAHPLIDAIPNREALQTAAPIAKKKRVCSKRVLLTFAGDGEMFAKDVASSLRQPRGNHLPIGVLILNEHPNKVAENPYKFITKSFAKFDYVVGILTQKYLEHIGVERTYTTQVKTTSSNIDERYVGFIYNLMTKYYMENNCLNYKIRFLIPDDIIDTVLSHPQVQVDPLFNVYLRLSETNVLAEWMLKSK